MSSFQQKLIKLGQCLVEILKPEICSFLLFTVFLVYKL